MRIYKSEMRVNYWDTDAMKVVYHANYFKFFEYGRCEMLRQAGFPYRELEERGVMLPVLSIHCDYKRPAFYDDLLEIHTIPELYKGARLTLRYEIYRKETGELLVTGSSVSGTVGTDMKPVNMKKRFPDLHEKLLSLSEEVPEEGLLEEESKE